MLAKIIPSVQEHKEQKHEHEHEHLQSKLWMATTLEQSHTWGVFSMRTFYSFSSSFKAHSCHWKPADVLEQKIAPDHVYLQNWDIVNKLGAENKWPKAEDF